MDWLFFLQISSAANAEPQDGCAVIQELNRQQLAPAYRSLHPSSAVSLTLPPQDFKCSLNLYWPSIRQGFFSLFKHLPYHLSIITPEFSVLGKAFEQENEVVLSMQSLFQYVIWNYSS